MQKLLDKFLDYMSAFTSDSIHTQDAYRRDVNRFIEYLESIGLTLREVDIHVASQYIMLLKEGKFGAKKLANSSIVRNLSSLRTFYYYLIEFYQYQLNPFTLIKSQSQTRNLPDFLTYDEMIRLLNSIDYNSDIGLRNKCMLELMYACGLRVSELVSLKVEDINIEERFIRVIGKGDKERIVPFYPLVAKMLSKYLIEVRNNWQNNNMELFIKANGKPLTTRYVQMYVRDLALKANIAFNVHPHMFRHSFATHLLDNGADLRVVQELLGHEYLSTTQIYTHLSVDSLKKTYLATHPSAKAK
ncbi:MAG: site-specific tyrosine recombinase/integron integrase [Erysipelotrichaceae bacterium]